MSAADIRQDHPALAAHFERLHEVSREQAPSAKQRRDVLKRMAAVLRQHASQIESAIAADFGRRHPLETRLSDLLALFGSIDHALSSVGRWMQPSQRWPLWFTLPAQARVEYQPLGVVGILSAWNFPVLLALGPAVSALAAGNRVLIKPSEHGPRCAEVLQSILPNAMGSEWIAVHNGDASAAKAMCQLPLDHLVFVGSTAVGRQVMQQAAANLIPLTLELGGQCPSIVAGDAVSPRTAFELLRAKLLNAGQACVAPNHVWLPHDAIEPFTGWLREAWTKLYPGGVHDQHYTSIGHHAHHQKLQNMVAQALADQERGGNTRVLAFDENDDARRVMAPHVITQPSSTLDLVRDEIFGPILPLYGYRHLDEVFVALRRAPRPLVIHLYSEDARIHRQVREQTISGCLSINSAMVHFGQDDLPIGGVGASGFGRYHGHDGFLAFSHHRAVYQQHRPNALDLSLPPWKNGGVAARLLAWLAKLDT